MIYGILIVFLPLFHILLLSFLALLNVRFVLVTTFTSDS